MGFLDKIKNLQTKLQLPRNSAAFTTINILLGTGPIILPQPFFKAGFIFSALFTLIIYILSYNSACYIAQSIQKIGQHLKSSSLKAVLVEDSEHSISNTQQNPKTITTFDHREQFTYVYGQKWKLIPITVISVYLFGVAISKCIMTGKTLSKLLNDVPVLGTFQFWLAIFFLSGAAFSFKSIEKTKVMQIVIISVRFVSIALMLIGAFIIMGQNGGVQDLAPQGESYFFNEDYFGDIFSNLIFSFMFHHSLPGITKQLTQVKQIKSFIQIGFVIAGTAMFAIPITAAMAFGNDLVHRRVSMLGQSHDLIYYNQDFQGRLDFIYYIVSFYVFLNVAAFSIYIIVIRKNVLAIIRPQMDSDKISKTTVLTTAILLIVILIISFVLKNQIQTALNFTGGIFGCLILFIMPSLVVYKARKLFPTPKSFLNSYVWMPLAVVAIGVASLTFNLYQTISNLVK